MSAGKIQDKNKNEDDLLLIHRIQSGEVELYSKIQKKYTRIISSLIRRMVRNEDDIDDLTQETFIKAFNGLSRFQSGYSFNSWLFKIASNTCIDFLRKKRFTIISLNQQISNDDEITEIEIRDDSFVPDINMLANERKKALNDAINNLPENYKMIIKLRHEEDLDYVQISERLDMPLGTVKAHLFRARKMLLVSLKKHSYLFND